MRGVYYHRRASPKKKYFKQREEIDASSDCSNKVLQLNHSNRSAYSESSEPHTPPEKSKIDSAAKNNFWQKFCCCCCFVKKKPQQKINADTPLDVKDKTIKENVNNISRNETHFNEAYTNYIKGNISFIDYQSAATASQDTAQMNNSEFLLLVGNDSIPSIKSHFNGSNYAPCQTIITEQTEEQVNIVGENLL